MKLLNKNIFFIFLILINIFIYSINVSHASCFRVALLGDTGKIIKPDGLAVAMMIGEEKRSEIMTTGCHCRCLKLI